MSTTIARGNIVKMFAVSVTFNPASVATITTAEQTVTVTGVKVGDIVMAVNKPSHTTGVGVVNARVSAADTVAVQFVNPTAGSVDPASETWTFVIARPEPLGSIFNA
jgi:hypothetical protein